MISSLPALALACLAATTSQAKTTIVVDFGPHPSALSAAGSEAQVEVWARDQIPVAEDLSSLAR